MKNAARKTYRCTDHGADATAHEEDKLFVIHAGSRFGEIRNRHDHLMLQFRRGISRDFDFDEETLTLNEDVKLLYADEAARIVTGCICDENSWIAEDGSHPTLVSPEWQRELQYGAWLARGYQPDESGKRPL